MGQRPADRDTRLRHAAGAFIVLLVGCTHRNTLGPSASVVAGDAFTCARLASGQVRCCGQGWEGELGNGAYEDEGHLVDVGGVNDATSLAAGGFHACAVRKDGSVWCWGENRVGQLGYAYPEKNATARATEKLDGSATQVALGILHSCARMADGTARCWGAGSKGELGSGGASDSSGPVRVAGLDHSVQLAVGSFHSCARIDDGTVRCWGANDRGQLGDGTTENRLAPTQVVGIAGAVEIAVGNDHGCARLGSGEVACWGGGEHLTRASAVGGVAHAVQVVSREDWACARLQAGSVLCWSVGNAPKERLAGVAKGGFTDLAVGGSHTCGVDAQGELHCEGAGSHGQLCDGSSPPRSSTFPPP
jgi:alpha-tubulin suppressor-like RCC1 family protein